MYVVRAKAENGGVYRLLAYPFQHQGSVLSTRAVKASGFASTMKALHLDEPQISGVRKTLENGGEVEIGGRAGQRIFGVPQLVAAGFEAVEA
jgi:hypothetical protein